MEFHITLLVWGSRPEVGSSRMSRRGEWTRALAISALRLWPPDSMPYGRSANSRQSDASIALDTDASTSSRPYMDPRTSRFSRTVSPLSSIGSWKTTPMSFLTKGDDESFPNTEMDPESGRSRAQIMAMVVDLPAPLGPKKATNEPSGTVMDTESTACRSPNDLETDSSLRASIGGSTSLFYMTLDEIDSAVYGLGLFRPLISSEVS